MENKGYITSTEFISSIYNKFGINVTVFDVCDMAYSHSDKFHISSPLMDEDNNYYFNSKDIDFFDKQYDEYLNYLLTLNENHQEIDENFIETERDFFDNHNQSTEQDESEIFEDKEEEDEIYNDESSEFEEADENDSKNKKEKKYKKKTPEKYSFYTDSEEKTRLEQAKYENQKKEFEKEQDYKKHQNENKIKEEKSNDYKKHEFNKSEFERFEKENKINEQKNKDYNNNEISKKTEFEKKKAEEAYLKDKKHHNTVIEEYRRFDKENAERAVYAKEQSKKIEDKINEYSKELHKKQEYEREQFLNKQTINTPNKKNGLNSPIYNNEEYNKRKELEKLQLEKLKSEREKYLEEAKEYEKERTKKATSFIKDRGLNKIQGPLNKITAENTNNANLEHKIAFGSTCVIGTGIIGADYFYRASGVEGSTFNKIHNIDNSQIQKSFNSKIENTTSSISKLSPKQATPVLLKAQDKVNRISANVSSTLGKAAFNNSGMRQTDTYQGYQKVKEYGIRSVNNATKSPELKAEFITSVRKTYNRIDMKSLEQGLKQNGIVSKTFKLDKNNADQFANLFASGAIYKYGATLGFSDLQNKSAKELELLLKRGNFSANEKNYLNFLINERKNGAMKTFGQLNSLAPGLVRNGMHYGRLMIKGTDTFKGMDIATRTVSNVYSAIKITQRTNLMISNAFQNSVKRRITKAQLKGKPVSAGLQRKGNAIDRRLSKKANKLKKKQDKIKANQRKVLQRRAKSFRKHPGLRKVAKKQKKLTAVMNNVKDKIKNSLLGRLITSELNIISKFKSALIAIWKYILIVLGILLAIILVISIIQGATTAVISRMDIFSSFEKDADTSDVMNSLGGKVLSKLKAKDDKFTNKIQGYLNDNVSAALKDSGISVKYFTNPSNGAKYTITKWGDSKQSGKIQNYTESEISNNKEILSAAFIAMDGDIKSKSAFKKIALKSWDNTHNIDICICGNKGYVDSGSVTPYMCKNPTGSCKDTYTYKCTSKSSYKYEVENGNGIVYGDINNKKSTKGKLYPYHDKSGPACDNSKIVTTTKTVNKYGKKVKVTTSHWVCKGHTALICKGHLKLKLDITIVPLYAAEGEINYEFINDIDEVMGYTGNRYFSSFPGATGNMKCYMDYRTITSKSSIQYKMQHSSKYNAYTDKYGLRKIGNYYCVALGTGISSKKGTKYKVTLSTGKTFNVILSETKSDRHTDEKTHTYVPSNGNIVEFIVDEDKLPAIVKKLGNVGGIKKFDGDIASIKSISSGKKIALPDAKKTAKKDKNNKIDIKKYTINYCGLDEDWIAMIYDTDWKKEYGVDIEDSGYFASYGSGFASFSDVKNLPKSNFLWPVNCNYITSKFGYRIHPITGVYKAHMGVDIGVGTGTPVRAIESGKVIVASKNYGGYGQAVVIKHKNGYSSLYGHNSSLKVSVGQKVKKGDIISYSGNTGASQGPHLHFEIKYNGNYLNPESFYNKKGFNYAADA